MLFVQTLPWSKALSERTESIKFSKLYSRIEYHLKEWVLLWSEEEYIEPNPGEEESYGGQRNTKHHPG